MVTRGSQGEIIVFTATIKCDEAMVLVPTVYLSSYQLLTLPATWSLLELIQFVWRRIQAEERLS